MTARLLGDVYDDCTTLVMPTRPPSHATSSVMPTELSLDARGSAGTQPIRSSVQAVRNGVPASRARSSADEKTRPSLRYTSDLQRYRRLSLMLAITLAFVLGVTASLAAQMSAHFTPVVTRTPRDGITRGEWLSIIDGVEMKAAPSVRPRRLVPRSPTAPSATASPAASTSASPPASPAASTSASPPASSPAPSSAPTAEAPSGPTVEPESMAPSSAAPDDGPSDLLGRDLLREGLSAD